MSELKKAKDFEYDTKNTQRIMEVLKKSTRGLTITDVADELKLNRHTVTKILEKMLIEKRANYDEKGPAKIFYYTGESKFIGRIDQGTDDVLWMNVFKPNYPGEEEFVRINQTKHDHLTRSSNKYRSVGAVAIRRRCIASLIRVLKDVARDEMNLKV